MSKPKKIRGTHFFLEMIVATILSIVSASLWTDLMRGVIAKHFTNNVFALFCIALIVTFAAIIGLKQLFAEIPRGEEGYIREKEKLINH